MAVDPYPILDLTADSPVLTEQLGSKPKFWFAMPIDTQPWLFKYAREGTGEHWSEKIAAEIAHTIGLPAARVELAEFAEKRGVACRSFVRRDLGFSLVHGDELLAGHVVGYARDKVFHQRDHSVANIVAAIRSVFADPAAQERQLTAFAGLIVFDAMIGNTDRHHQNWAILKRTHSDGSLEHELAPSYDHASSLGRNAPSEEMRRRLVEKTVLAYARKGRGGIFWSGHDRKGANPLDLAIRAAEQWPVHFSPWLERLRQIDLHGFEDVIAKVPDDWMDTLQKRFCLDFLCQTCSELKNLRLP